MSNVVSQNPMIIDTAQATSVMTTTINVRVIKWAGAASGASVAIIDGSSKTMWEASASWASFAPTGDTFPGDRPLVLASGFAVPTLSSGRLYLYTQ